MILLDKTLEEIMEETLTEIEGMGLDAEAGSIARLLTGILNTRLSTYYTALRVNHAQAFVSKATGRFLDHIGVLLDCIRLPEEINDDESYRYRITKQIQVVASANRIAIRLAALSVPGVQDVMMKRWTHGTGSFSVYVITEDPVTPDEILALVQERVDEVEAFGMRGEVYRPSILGTEIKVRLLFNRSVTDLDKQLAVAKGQDELKRYINSRNVGEPLVIRDMISMLEGIHENVEEAIVFNYKINNRAVLPVDQTCAWNERFVESEKANAIQVL